MSIFGTLTTLLDTAVGASAAGASLYLLTVSVAALFHRPAPPVSVPRHRLMLVVPAHDEAMLIARCLRSLSAQSYPADLRRIAVVADNCTDETADVAAAGGAEVLVRTGGSRGKGQALRWAFDRLLEDPWRPDAVVVVDADSVADPDLVAVLEAHLGHGAGVVQAEYLALAEDDSPRSALRGAAFLLFHRTRFAGRAVLGMPCNLVGNGMLFSRRVLEEHPWTAFTSAEDLEYSMDLRLAGVRPVFAAAAQVRAPVAGRGRGARTQRLRWEGGRFHVVRTRLTRLLVSAAVTGDWRRLDAALDLAVPPLGLLVLITGAGTVLTALLVGTGVAPGWALASWVVACAAIPAYVLVGLRAAGAPASAYRALLQAPVFVLAKIGTYLRLARGLHADRWERTERPAPPNSAALVDDRRVQVAGVPIDAVDIGGAVRTAMSAVHSGALLHVCTVNLHFLVTARRDAAVQSILNRSGMNVADGVAVVWLARIQGHRLPGRVAGADLVPSLLSSAARLGARVFLLGGEGGAGTEAARRLRERHPGLVICGVHEPPVTAHSAMDNEEILRLIAGSRADILLVAFGHPKQERWIDLHRERLPVSVAVGVGCTLDLIAGRRTRAPLWMRRSGLEWLHRALHEPRRLLPRYVLGAGWFLFVLAPGAVFQLAVGRAKSERLSPPEAAALKADPLKPPPRPHGHQERLDDPDGSRPDAPPPSEPPVLGKGGGPGIDAEGEADELVHVEGLEVLRVARGQTRVP